MSEPTAPVGEVPNEQPQVETSQPVEAETNGHPAWNEILDILPEGFHGPIKERLSKWDSNVQNLVQKVHSEYEPYKPFKEQGVEPQVLDAAYRLFQMANSDPRALYDQLGEYFGFATEQGQQEQQQNNEEFNLGEEESQVNLEQHPAYQQLAQQQQMLQEYLAQQHAVQEQQKADAWLDQQINALPETIRNDKNAMNYILNVTQVEAARTGDFDKAFAAGVEAFNALTNNLRSMPRAGDSAPQIMPAGGGLPASKNPAEMSDAERRQAGASLLAALQQER